MKIKKAFNKQLGKTGWQLDCTVDGQRHRQWYATRKEAEDAHAALTLAKRSRKLGLALPKKSQRLTLDDLVAAREREMTGYTSWHQTENYLAEFLALFPAGTAVESVTAKHLAHWQTLLLKRGLRHSTINLYLTKAHALLNAVPRLFPELADYRAPHLAPLPTSPSRKRVLTGPELVTIYRALCQPELQPYEQARIQAKRLATVADLFLLCLLTGARQSELLALKWTAISADFGTFTLDSPKTRDRRVLPLTPTLHQLFEQRRAHGTPAHVFAQDTKPFTRNRIFERTGELTGIPFGAEVENGWTLHTLRHTAITVMLHARADFISVQEVVGHRHASQRQNTTLQYAHANLEAMADALNKLAAFWQQACRDFDGRNGENPSNLQQRAHKQKRATG